MRLTKAEFSVLKTYLMAPGNSPSTFSCGRCAHHVRRTPLEMEKEIMTNFKTACAAMLASMLIAAPAFAQDAAAFGYGSPYDSYAYMGPAPTVHHGRAASRNAASEVYLENGAEPPAWQDTSLHDETPGVVPPKPVQSPSESSKSFHYLGKWGELGPGFSPEGIFDPEQRGIGETRMNKATYDFIRNECL